MWRRYWTLSFFNPFLTFTVRVLSSSYNGIYYTKDNVGFKSKVFMSAIFLTKAWCLVLVGVNFVSLESFNVPDISLFTGEFEFYYYDDTFYIGVVILVNLKLTFVLNRSKRLVFILIRHTYIHTNGNFFSISLNKRILLALLTHPYIGLRDRQIILKQYF